jgi:4-hydroxymandelate oxidase
VFASGTDEVCMSQRLVNLDDYEAAARSLLDEQAFEYVASGAGSETTLRANRAAFDDLELLPRMLRDVSRIDTEVELFGRTHRMPVLLAPTGYHRLMHPRGELETIAGANLADCTMIAANFATESFVDVQAQATRPQWFQMYVQNDRSFTRDLLQEVLAAGCEAVCVTVDQPVNAIRDREARIGFELPKGMERANLKRLGALAAAAHSPEGFNIYNAVRAADLTWKDLEWLRSECTVPLLLKGILHPDDAILAQQSGCDGIIVSNHGGRALDGVQATLTALPAIVAAVPEMTVLMDGGIRRGTDIVKALALGAEAVLLGRPYLFGLAVDGAAGVAQVINMLHMELQIAMGLMGCSNVEQLQPSLLHSRKH